MKPSPSRRSDTDGMALHQDFLGAGPLGIESPLEVARRSSPTKSIPAVEGVDATDSGLQSLEFPEMSRVANQRLLAVDDDPRCLRELDRVATEAGYVVETTPTGFEFMDLTRTFKPTVMAIDIFMPEVDGIELIRWLGAEHIHAKIILLSEFRPIYAKCAVALATRFELGPITVLDKPFAPVALLRALG